LVGIHFNFILKFSFPKTKPNLDLASTGGLLEGFLYLGFVGIYCWKPFCLHLGLWPSPLSTHQSIIRYYIAFSRSLFKESVLPPLRSLSINCVFPLKTPYVSLPIEPHNTYSVTFSCTDTSPIGENPKRVGCFGYTNNGPSSHCCYLV